MKKTIMPYSNSVLSLTSLLFFSEQNNNKEISQKAQQQHQKNRNKKAVTNRIEGINKNSTYI